jgi:GH43 family beta-xylosidase
MGICWRMVVALAAWAMLAASCALRPAAGIRPALDIDFPDPFVLVTNDGLVAYATNTRRDGRRLNVQVSRSRDGTSWNAPVEAMPSVPRWALQDEPDIWAPEAIRIGDRYVLYFSARHATRMRKDGRTLCIGAAIAADPMGPFTPLAQPLTCGGEHGVIDASPFRDGTALWLYVKTDGNCCGVPTTFQVLRLAPDGFGVIDAPVVLRGIANDRDWEGRVVEAPQMVARDGRYLLFYAGNDYGNARYATGYAVCDGPTGPCRDAAENPILRNARSNGAPVGPGHQSVFEYRGRTWIAYHGWRPAREGHKRYRAMYIEPLDWIDGRPIIDRL